MTAIVALVDADGTVYMGGDSAGTNQMGDQSILLNRKVFSPERGNWFVFGCCGQFRFAQVLQYSYVPPPPPGPTMNLDAFMTTTFIESVKRCFRKAGILTTDTAGAEVGYTFLVGYQGRVFKVEENFQVLCDARQYTAVGAGESIALGALYATDGLASPEDRVRLALKASANYNATVREPFHVHALPFREDWYRDLRTKKTPARKNGSRKK
jgi:hypothetical protein